MRLWIGIVLIAGILAMTGIERGSADETKRDYLIKYLVNTPHREKNYHGLGHIKVLTFDTRTRESNWLQEPFADKVRVSWCRNWYQLLDVRPGDSVRQEELEEWRKEWNVSSAANGWLRIDWMQVPGVEAIIHDLQTVGVMAEAKGWSFGSCHPPAGLLAVVGVVTDDLNDSTNPLAVFLGVLEPSTGEVQVILEIESGMAETARHSRYYRPFFDVDGRYLYYNWADRAKRYDIETQVLDTIAAGDIPIVPWNEQAAIVYSSSDEQYRLLDENLNVVSTIDSELEGTILCAHAVDPHTFLVAVGCVFYNSLAPGKDGSTGADIRELDFQAGTARVLARGISPDMQILDAHVLD